MVQPIVKIISNLTIAQIDVYDSNHGKQCWNLADDINVSVAAGDVVISTSFIKWVTSSADAP